MDGHCCVPLSRRRRAASSRSAARDAAVRIELHPDGQLFFVQNFAAHHQQTIQTVAQQRPPQFADQSQLLAQRSRGPLTGARSRSNRLMAFAPSTGISGRVAKYSGKLLRDLAVNGLLRKRLIFKQFLEWLKGLVAIGGPQKQQFFQRRRAVWYCSCFAAEPLVRSLLAAHHALPGKCSTNVSSSLSSSLRGRLGLGKPVQR